MPPRNRDTNELIEFPKTIAQFERLRFDSQQFQSNVACWTGCADCAVTDWCHLRQIARKSPAHRQQWWTHSSRVERSFHRTTAPRIRRRFKQTAILGALTWTLIPGRTLTLCVPAAPSPTRHSVSQELSGPSGRRFGITGIVSQRGQVPHLATGFGDPFSIQMQPNIRQCQQ